MLSPEPVTLYSESRLPVITWPVQLSGISSQPSAFLVSKSPFMIRFVPDGGPTVTVKTPPVVAVETVVQDVTVAEGVVYEVMV